MSQPVSGFVFDQPVTDARFVGRDSLCRTLLSGVDQGRSFALYGGPRMGLTSVLLALTPLSRALWRQRPGATKIVPVYLDVATWPTARPQAVSRLVWDAVKTAVLDPYVQSHGTPPRPRSADFLRTQTPWDLYQELATELWQGFGGTSGWCRYVLVLDNAHALSDGPLIACLDDLGALVRAQEPWAAMAWVLAGQAPLRSLVQRRPALQRTLRQLNLTVLRDHDVETLVRHGGLPSTPDDIAALIRLTGKQPYILQRLLHACSVTPAAPLDAIVGAVASDLAPHFARVLASFPKARVQGEHLLLAWLLAQGGEAPLVDAENSLSVGPLKLVTDFLEFSGLAEKVLRGTHTLLRAGGTLWNDWYAAHGPGF